MHKSKKPVILSLIAICLATLTIGIAIWLMSLHHSKELIYSTTYSFAFGSRSVQIYDNGEVHDDLEIEEPEHQPDYKLVKSLTAEQIQELKDKKNTGVGSKELADFVIELVYGVKEFDNMGRY